MLPPKNTRDFFDPLKLNSLIQTHVLDGFKRKLGMIESGDHKIEVANIHFDHKTFSLEDQKTAVLEKKDLTYPVKGTFNLLDKKTGNILESKNVTIANIPHITERNTVIYNGSEYEPVHQQRLLPGIYSRIRQSGEAEAHINPAPRSGVSARILFLPDKQLFVMMIQNTQIRLYGVLKELGISDSQMSQAWGSEILSANKQAYRGDEIDKLYDKLYQN
jgi:DNA-directed RNA polymerase beta subunit